MPDPTSTGMTAKDRAGNLRQTVQRSSSVRERVGSFIYESKTTIMKQVNRTWRYGFCGGISVAITILISAWYTVPGAQLALCGDKLQNVATIRKFSADSGNLVAVNLGGWLCLEDWFHSGATGRFVSTPDALPQGQGACLPPLLNGPLPQPWPSEGVLVQRLAEKEGKDYAAEVFQAFREDFIKEDDFEKISSLGIKTIRIPFSWSLFADALIPIDNATYGLHDPEWEPVVVPDPFHTDEIKAVTIPRHWFKETLRLAAKHGLRVIMDLHSSPGGSSDGTYSGIWPLRPAFWNESAQFGNTSITLQQAGLLVVKALIKFLEEDVSDLVDQGAIWGVCFMNEPAHLSGINAKWGQFATPDQVLAYVDQYSELFRTSSLPTRGVRLYIQLIETAWASGDAFDKQVPEWYHSKFTAEERHGWAVIARHFYTAWGCNGEITLGSAYQCDEPVEKIRAILRPCIANFAEGFAEKYDGLRAVTEWSLGSHSDANLACSNSDVLRTLFEENVNAFALISKTKKESLIEPVFWSWKMPYGPKFQPGWSLKYFSGMDDENDGNGKCIVGDWARESPLTGVQ